MMTVNFGTCAQDTRVTIFAPSRAMPPPRISARP
jgi:hypothetical protein